MAGRRVGVQAGMYVGSLECALWANHVLVEGVVVGWGGCGEGGDGEEGVLVSHRIGTVW